MIFLCALYIQQAATFGKRPSQKNEKDKGDEMGESYCS